MIKHLVISLTRFSMVLALQTADIMHHRLTYPKFLITLPPVFLGWKALADYQTAELGHSLAASYFPLLLKCTYVHT